MSRRRSWDQTTRSLVATLGVTGAPLPPSPASPLRRALSSAWQFPTYSEPLAQNLTGLPARIYRGYTARAPQALAAIEDQLQSADPIQGVSTSAAGRWPSLPSRRLPLIGDG